MKPSDIKVGRTYQGCYRLCGGRGDPSGPVTKRTVLRFEDRPSVGERWVAFSEWTHSPQAGVKRWTPLEQFAHWAESELTNDD